MYYMLYKYAVQLMHTADVKLESCQSKGSCWLRKWFLLPRFDTYWLLQYLGRTLIKQLIGKKATLTSYVLRQKRLYIFF